MPSNPLEINNHFNANPTMPSKHKSAGMYFIFRFSFLFSTIQINKKLPIIQIPKIIETVFVSNTFPLILLSFHEGLARRFPLNVNLIIVQR